MWCIYLVMNADLTTFKQTIKPWKGDCRWLVRECVLRYQVIASWQYIQIVVHIISYMLAWSGKLVVRNSLPSSDAILILLPRWSWIPVYILTTSTRPPRLHSGSSWNRCYPGKDSDLITTVYSNNISYTCVSKFIKLLNEAEWCGYIFLQASSSMPTGYAVPLSGD